jgi:hypothetical protein
MVYTSGLKIGNHASDATCVFRTNMVGTAKVALTLCRLLGQDVALERVAGLELAGSGLPEALGSGTVGLDLGLSHDSSNVDLETDTSGDEHTF